MKVSTIYLIIATLILFFIFSNASSTEAIYIQSSYDGRKYLVRNEEDKEMAANMLAKIREKLYSLRDYLYENRNKYTDEYKKYIETMYERMTNMIISENTPNSSYTSYTVNKGDEMIFCIRSKKTNKIHDLNLMMFVAIHEMGHVMCPEEGHTKLFGEIFMFLLGVAISISLYFFEDFTSYPRNYCGMDINESPVPDYSKLKENNGTENKKSSQI